MKVNLIDLPSTGYRKVRTLDGFFHEKDYPITDVEFGSYLRKIRNENNMSLLMASSRMGITVPQLSSLEIGRRYKFCTSDDMEAALNVVLGRIP